MGSHEQVGCEKPSTLSGRQKTVLVVAVDRIVCVCVCVRVVASVCTVCVLQAFTTLTMWVCGHSSFSSTLLAHQTYLTEKKKRFPV